MKDPIEAPPIMSIVLNYAKRRLEAGELAIGFSVSFWRMVNIAKIAKTCGYDWLFIDMEHGTAGVELVTEICIAALDAGISPIVRVPGHEHHHAARVLDGGAMGVVLPHVDTVDEARRVAGNCKFPPLGHRSVPPTLPQLGYATLPAVEAMRLLNESILLVVMLESPEAIDNAEAIAAIDGIDVLLIGTNDLAAEMGIPGEIGDKKISAAYERVIAAARKHGKFAGMGGVYGEDLMKKYIGMGARLVLGGGDLAFMRVGAQARCEFLRSLSDGEG